MAEFHAYYSPEDPIGINLRETAERFERLCEQELGHIRELAIEISEESESLSDILASLPDLSLFQSTERSAAVPIDSQPALDTLHTLHTAHRKLLLCTELKKKLSEKEPLTADAFFSDSAEHSVLGENRVFYQKSTYTDAAYLQFAPLLHAPRAAYAHSFPAACEEVFNGLCEYCILPIENTSEGTLHSFLRLIERYELKIAATCEVSDRTAERTTQFALLCKHLLPSLATDQKADFFAFSIPSAPNELPDVLTAARLCGLRIHRFDMLPLSADRVSVRIILQIDGGDLEAFLLYLAMDLPQYVPLGLYSQVISLNKRI